MIRAIVFDFDGVILESVDIKTQAFHDLFQDHPDEVDRIVDLHRNNTGVSRFEKFKIIYRDILGKPLDDIEMDRLGREFSRLVYAAILRCDFVPGAQEFLEKHHRTYPLYIASATPEDEMRRIAADRGLARYFRGIFGSPSTKGDILSNILAEGGYRPHEVVFIGDAMSDYKGARAASVPFIGRRAPDNPVDFPDAGVLGRIDDLLHLDREWSRLMLAIGQ